MTKKSRSKPLWQNAPRGRLFLQLWGALQETLTEVTGPDALAELSRCALFMVQTCPDKETSDIWMDAFLAGTAAVYYDVSVLQVKIETGKCKTETTLDRSRR